MVISRATDATFPLSRRSFQPFTAASPRRARPAFWWSIRARRPCLAAPVSARRDATTGNWRSRVSEATTPSPAPKSPPHGRRRHTTSEARDADYARTRRLSPRGKVAARQLGPLLHRRVGDVLDCGHRADLAGGLSAGHSPPR